MKRNGTSTPREVKERSLTGPMPALVEFTISIPHVRTTNLKFLDFFLVEHIARRVPDEPVQRIISCSIDSSA
jgi:hypothetical protein